MLQQSNPSMTAIRPSFWRRHRVLKWLGVCCLLFIVAFSVATVIAARRAEPFLRSLIVEWLEQKFQARVELDSFHVSLAKGLRAEGKGLRIWPPAELGGLALQGAAAPAQPPPGKPLIDLAEFSFRAPLHYSSGKPIRISLITLRGLTIDIPPKPLLTHGMSTIEAAPSATGSPAAAGSQPAAGPQSALGPRVSGLPGMGMLHFVIGMVVCTDARLTLENRNPAKEPLDFEIQTVKVTHISPDGTMNYEATLTNPRPRGLVNTSGILGPWIVKDPGMMPLHGSYTFKNADLGTFKGISGTLNSTGTYQGPLRDLTVDGVTDTPNFALTHFGTAMPLHTQFHATVDGTNGDTYLQPVYATLGHSQFTTQGKIVQLPGKPATNTTPAEHGGHEIALDVNVPNGQMADFLRLVSHSGNPMLTGTLHMKTTLDIPPGGNPVHERIRLNGSFVLDDAQFASQKVQSRVGELSLRGQGKPGDANTAAAADVRSTMESNFTMANAVVNLPNLVYIVPGAEIDLSGNYDIDGGGLAFTGNARMQATVSQMVGGWKGALLKPMDRFFKKDGAGTRVRVHIDGTREDPHFGVDF